MFWSYLPHPNSKSCTVSFFRFITLQGTLFQAFRFFLNPIDQLGTVQMVHWANLRGALFLLILWPKSYLVRAHKPQISPRNGLGPVLGHVMGFLQPTLGPLGYLVVKEISICGRESYRYKSCMLLPFSFALVFALDVCCLVLEH